jgi:FkbM family methyltransferase
MARFQHLISRLTERIGLGGKAAAARFYMRALLSSIGLVDSDHRPSDAERTFWRYAVPLSSSVLELGPRTDTDLIGVCREFDVNFIAFEANPFFARRLKHRVRSLGFSKSVQIFNVGVGSSSGTMSYYFLNQSFLKNTPFPTLGIRKRISVVSLDTFFAGLLGPDFIKSDIEGLDLAAFRGAKELLKSLKFFQVEMCSLNPSEYHDLFQDFNLFLILDEVHPLYRKYQQQVIPIEIVGYEDVFNSMRRGETNNLCGVRKGLEHPFAVG